MMDVSERIQQPTPDDADRLCEVDGSWCVSIYLPVRAGFGEVAQNAIRLKNLVRTAEERLGEEGVDPGERSLVLSRIQDVLPTGRSLRFPSGGLAIFLTRDDATWYHLPDAPEEIVHVGRRFHVRPVLDALADDRRCFVLSLGLDGVHLSDCTPLGTESMELPDVPGSLADALRFDVVEPHRQYHSGSSRRGGGQGIAALVHGQGGGADQARVKKQILEYFRQVSSGVSVQLAGHEQPLVLVGPPHLVGLYREANRYPHLFDEAVLSDPDGLEDGEICVRALEVLRPREERRIDELIDRFGTLRSTHPDRTVTGVEDIVTAASRGRVDTLIVGRGLRVWGRYAEPDRPVVHERKKSGDEDLVDRAAWFTLRQGGMYRPVDPETVPGGGPTAAILRY